MAPRRGISFRLFGGTKQRDWRKAPRRGRRRQNKKQLEQSEGRLAYDRIVQTLEARHEAGKGLVILVVGAAHGDGASTVSNRLGTFLSARRGRRVLVVDANLRSPGVHEAGRYPSDDGLTRVLQGEQDLDAALLGPERRGPWLLPCGPSIERPSQVLNEAAIATLMGRLRPMFDFVLLDGPPVTGYTDSAVLAAHADAVVLVVGAERTRWETAHEAVRQIEETGTELLGAILNRRRFYIPESIYKRL